MPTPYYLNPKRTKLPAGHDETLDPSEEPTDSAMRVLAPNTWPVRDTSPGPRGPRDRPAGHRPTDPARRSLPPFEWARTPQLAQWLGDLDPDIALWPVDIVNRWPFTGPPTTGVWPTGWIGVDNTPTVWLCTVGGQPGTWVPIGVTTGWVTPQMFDAYGDGVHDDTAAVQAAFNAGPNVYLPPGTYLCSALITVPNWNIAFGNYTGHLQGSGWNSALVWTINGNQGTCEHSGESIGLTPFRNYLISDVFLRGPGTGQTAGANNQTFISGFYLTGGTRMENVLIENFHAGIIAADANHVLLNRVRCYGNFYGMTFPDYSVSNGNVTINMSNFEANALAGWRIGGNSTGGAGNSFAELAEVTDTSFSNQPWAIIITDSNSGWDGNNNPIYTGTCPSNPPVYLCRFDNLDCEWMGNGFLLDMSRYTQTTANGGTNNTASVNQCNFRRVYTSRRTSNAWNQAPVPALYQNQNWWWVAGVANTIFDLEGAATFLNYTTPLTRAWFDATFVNVPNGMWSTNTNNYLKMFTQALDGATWDPNFTSVNPQWPTFISRDGRRKAIMSNIAATPSQAGVPVPVASGQLLQAQPTNFGNYLYMQAGCDSTYPLTQKTITGVALTPTDGSHPFLLAISGRIGDATPFITTGPASLIGDDATYYPTTPYQIARWTSYSTQQKIGTMLHQSAAGAMCGLELRMGL